MIGPAWCRRSPAVQAIVPQAQPLGLPEEPARRPSDRASNQARRRPSGQAQQPKAASGQPAARRHSGQLSSRRRHNDRAKPRRDSAFSGVQSRRQGSAPSQPRPPKHGEGASGARRRPRGGGGRRSDIALKHDITLLGHLDNGLGFYRFSYVGSDRAYVGVMAQEVLTIIPEAVVRGRDGYLRVYYDKLGLKFQTYDRWIASGARIPTITHIRH